MWMLSGAFFPASGASTAIWVLMMVNPLSYGLSALRRVLYGEATADSLGDPSLLSSLGVTVGFAIVALAVAVWMAGRPEKN